MDYSIMLTLNTLLNIGLVIFIIFLLIRGVKKIIAFLNRTKEMDKKIDEILENIKKDT